MKMLLPHHPLGPAARLAAATLMALGLAACASLPQPEATPVAPTASASPAAAAPAEAPAAVTADRLLAAGKDLAAAKAYIKAAADTQGDAQLQYLLDAAHASLRGQKPQDAVLLADEVLRLQHDPKLRGEALWIRSQGLMDQGQTPKARGNLEELLTLSSTPQGIRAEALGILATLYTQEGHDLTALNFLIQRDNLLSQGSARDENHRRIRVLLDAQPVAKLQNWQSRTASPLVQEWIALDLIARNTPDPQQREQAIAAWMAAHPHHPAIQFSENAPAAATATSAQGDVCALLPATGPYAPLSQAIAAGLETSARLTGGPAVRVYQSTGNSEYTATLFQRGVKAGCAVFVGPWLRQDINAVVGVRRPSDPPVLTLGLDPDLHQPGLYQFSQSRNAASAQIAQQGFAAGYRQVYLLYPQDSSGAAIQAAFLSDWKGLGGRVAGVAAYTPGQDPQAAVQQLFTGVIPARSFVFLVADASVAGQAVPEIHQIKPDLAVFSPSLLRASGLPSDASALAGLASVDMPWIIDPAQSWPQAAALLHTQLPNADDAQWRMAAFGLDAYRLAVQILHHQTGQGLQGTTGTLHFGADGIVARAMQWMQFQQGQIVPLARAPRPGS